MGSRCWLNPPFAFSGSDTGTGGSQCVEGRKDHGLYTQPDRLVQGVAGLSFKFLKIVSKAEGLPRGANHLLRALADYADDAGRCFPSHRELSYRTGQGTRSIIRHMATLEAFGWIARERRHRKDGSRASDYITVHDQEEAARRVAASLNLPLMTVVENPNQVPKWQLGQGAKMAVQEEPIKEELNLKKEKTGSRPPHKSGDRPSEDQHQMAERIRRMG